MAVSSLTRPMLRAPALRMASRRFESTAAGKAADAAKDTASKAQQGLSRVTSAAGPAIAGAARGVTSALGKIGGRTGRFIAFVERTSPAADNMAATMCWDTNSRFNGCKTDVPMQDKLLLSSTTPRSASRPASSSSRARR